MGSPEEEYWEDEGIVSNIMSRMMINPHSRGTVMIVLINVLAAEDKELKFNAMEGYRKRGRSMIVKENDASAKSLYNCLATGCGITAAADILNLSGKYMICLQSLWGPSLISVAQAT